LGDVAADGSVLSPPAQHRHKVPAYLSYPDYRAAIGAASGVTEVACAHPVRVPDPAQVLLAAHHAHRRQHGAVATDPFFVNPLKPAEQASYSGMREHALRTAARLHRTPPWLHRDPCRFGSDIGLNPRPFGWLIERGLSVHILDQHLAACLPHPVRRSRWSHHFHGGAAQHAERLGDLPFRVIVDLARRLDMHPAEFVASLHSALANNRDTIWPASDPDTVPSRPGAAGDADVVLAALAHAVEALTVDELATALAWSLDRVTAALDYAAQHPEVAGPVAARRTEPGTYTVTARLDRLTAAQRQNLGQLHLYRNPLPVEHVTVLLAVLALSAAPSRGVPRLPARTPGCRAGPQA
jgi:hypothetical protein